MYEVTNAVGHRQQGIYAGIAAELFPTWLRKLNRETERVDGRRNSIVKLVCVECAGRKLFAGRATDDWKSAKKLPQALAYYGTEPR